MNDVMSDVGSGARLPQGVPTHVLVKLTLRQEVELQTAMAVMRAEMVATARLYLGGKIEQWFSLMEERGVLFLFRSGEPGEVRGLMEELPLVQAGLAELEFTRLGPLQPLGVLL